MTENNNANIFWQDTPVSYRDRCSLLRQKGIVIWLTGLSGSGKSTLAAGLAASFSKNKKLAYVLDGDNIRHGLNSDLGFKEEDRQENIRRIAHTASLFRDAGVITIVSVISPLGQMRKRARSIIGEEYFFEVFVKADIDTCTARDPKGLYKKALSGEISNFTGISTAYEEPLNPDIVIDTTILTVGECVDAILKKVWDRILFL